MIPKSEIENSDRFNFPEHDSTNFLKKVDDSSGGLYAIHMKNAFEELTWSVIENIITQRFGSKATRIFRVIRLKKFAEQEDIQKEAMVHSKEAKLYTYKLLEENFLQIQTIKKSGGPAKNFYLFHVNQYHVSFAQLFVNLSLLQIVFHFADRFNAHRILLQGNVQCNRPFYARQREQQALNGEIDEIGSNR